MTDLSQSDFNKIVNFLGSLAPRADPSARQDSWRTADELLRHFTNELESITARQLDAALCKQFLKPDANCPIRPAYYPREDTCKRLWGHKDKVGTGPGREALREKLMAKPRPLESVQLADEAPVVFISHALEDYHCAARVRLYLERHKIRSWLAEGDMHEGCNLFEAIEAALRRCDALIVLISSMSISSAWLYTEVLTALKSEKQIVALVDASDAPMCDLIRGVTVESQKRLAGEKCEKWLDTDEGIFALSAALGRYMRAASPSRVLKFRPAVDYTLNSLTLAGSIAFYPNVPAAWDGSPSVIGFEEALDVLDLKKS